MESQQIFWIIWVIVAVTLIIICYIRGKRALAIFPDINEEQVIFREKWASGYTVGVSSLKGGTASQILDVSVTSNELWVKSPMLFAWILERGSLLTKVELSKIVNVSPKRRTIEIIYKTEDYTDRTIRIVLKNVEGFLRAIKHNQNH